MARCASAAARSWERREESFHRWRFSTAPTASAASSWTRLGSPGSRACSLALSQFVFVSPLDRRWKEAFQFSDLNIFLHIRMCGLRSNANFDSAAVHLYQMASPFPLPWLGGRGWQPYPALLEPFSLARRRGVWSKEPGL